MKAKIFTVAATLASTVIAVPVPEAVTIRADRPSAVYKVGERIDFTVTGPLDNVTCRISDGKSETAPQPLTEGKISVPAQTPGFVLVTLDLGKDKNGRPQTVCAGAAVEPEKIRPGVKMPDDFEAFWKREVAAMRGAKREVLKMEAISDEYLPAGFVGYNVAVKQGDVIATGYLVMPEAAAAHSLPAVLNFNGASKVSSELPIAVNIARTNHAISFNLNFHGLENFNLTAKRDLKREAAVRPQVARYQFQSADDRQNYAMRKIFLRVVLAADFVRSLPEFDGKRLVAAGGSLGGCQALVCAALVPEVVLCVSNATAMCDHFGKSAGHLPGWPDLLNRNPQAVKAAAYFDMVNFAALVKCPTRMAVGFIDVTCPPASTYAAYNNLGTADKRMFHTVTGGHGAARDRKERGVFSHSMRDIKPFLKSFGK
ncbi:MAG: acetylxylan esterase [Lentisphaeria bacterium]|nr:acetylxylan esterase [Lentisphaeria bacterium]